MAFLEATVAFRSRQGAYQMTNQVVFYFSDLEPGRVETHHPRMLNRVHPGLFQPYRQGYTVHVKFNGNVLRTMN